MKYYVYIYLDLNNIPFYVGKGSDNRYRIYRHLRKDSPNPLLKNKIKKIGVENVIVKFALKDVCEECALCCEVDLISTIGRRDLGTGTLCNLSRGGGRSRGYKHTKETRRKMSASHKGQIPWNKGKKYSKTMKQKMRGLRKGYPRKGYPGYWKGKHRSEETKQQISKSLKGQIPWNKGRKTGHFLKRLNKRCGA